VLAEYVEDVERVEEEEEEQSEAEEVPAEKEGTPLADHAGGSGGGIRVKDKNMGTVRARSKEVTWRIVVLIKLGAWRFMGRTDKVRVTYYGVLT